MELKPLTPKMDTGLLKHACPFYHTQSVELDATGEKMIINNYRSTDAICFDLPEAPHWMGRSIFDLIEDPDERQNLIDAVDAARAGKFGSEVKLTIRPHAHTIQEMFVQVERSENDKDSFTFRMSPLSVEYSAVDSGRLTENWDEEPLTANFFFSAARLHYSLDLIENEAESLFASELTEDQRRSISRILASALTLKQLPPALIHKTSKIRPAILIAEDNEPTGEMLRDFLSQFQYQVDWAPDGKMALEMALQNAYHLILADGQMPRMSGPELICKLRATWRYARTPIIGTIGHASGPEFDLMKNSGADTVISKPYKLTEVHQIVCQSLSIAAI